MNIKVRLLKTIQKRFALATKGAKDFCKGMLMTALLNMALFAIAVCFPAPAGAQGIEGKVIAGNGSQPIAGVSVRIAGTRTGTATGNDGL